MNTYDPLYYYYFLRVTYSCNIQHMFCDCDGDFLKCILPNDFFCIKLSCISSLYSGSEWQIVFMEILLPKRERKKNDLRGCDSCCSPLLQQKWKRCTDSSKGFFIYVQEAYSFTQTYQVGFVLHCLCAHNHLCPSVDYEKNFSKLFKCIAVEVNIFTQSSTLQFLIQ